MPAGERERMAQIAENEGGRCDGERGFERTNRLVQSTLRTANCTDGVVRFSVRGSSASAR
jgi:hypothetical protein